MMIRSAPPASASFAERPVPAPAPMIGLPAVDLRAQPRERLVARHRRLLDQLVQPVGHRGRERRVVDVRRRRSCSSTLSASVSLQRRRTSASSASGSWNGWPSTSIIETPRSGTNSAVGAASPPTACGRSCGRAPRTPPASCASASPSGCGRRGSGPRTARGTVSRGPKLTMSSAPSDTTCGRPAAPAASSRSGPAESTPPTSSSASSVVVTSSDAGEEAVLDERLHRLPAGAGRVEDEHLVAELLEPLARASSRTAS